MEKKTLILLGTILLALVAIVITPKIFKQSSVKKQVPKNVSVNMSGYSKETVSQITFGKADDMKTLSLSGNEWQINGEKADQGKVGSFFDDLQSAQVLSLASKNEDNHNKFEVTPEDGIILKITSNGKDDEFYIGKSGPSIGTFYIRKKGIKNVYLMKGDFNTELSRVESEWKEQQQDDSETGVNASGDQTDTGSMPSPPTQ